MSAYVDSRFPAQHGTSAPIRRSALVARVGLLARVARVARVGLLVALLVPLLPGAAVLSAPPASAAVVRGEPRPGLAAWFVTQINARRAEADRPGLTVSPALSAVAAGWAAHLARTNVLAHNPSLASAVRGWHYLGENVGVGYTAGSLEGAFWGSPTHRSNMLDPHYTQIGVAVVDVGGKLWVVEDYSRPFASAPTRAARPQHPSTHPKPSLLASRPRSSACSGGAQADRLFQARRNLRFGVNWVVVRQRQVGLGCPVRPAAR